MSNANVMRFTALGLAGGATVLLILCQFLPIEQGKESVFGDVTFNSNLWNQKASAGGGSESKGWFEDCDEGSDCDGVGLIRAGAIVLTIGLVAAAAATLLLGVLPGRIGAASAFGATGIVLAGFLLWTIGYGKLGEGQMNDITDPAVSFYLAIVAMALLVAAGVLALLTPTGPTRTAKSGRNQVNF